MDWVDDHVLMPVHMLCTILYDKLGDGGHKGYQLRAQLPYMYHVPFIHTPCDCNGWYGYW